MKTYAKMYHVMKRKGEAMEELIATYEEPQQAIQKQGKATYWDVVEVFLTSLDLKPRSVDTYRKSLKRFGLWLEDNGITSPTRADIKSYKAMLLDTYKTCTAASYLSAVRNFYAFLAAEGYAKDITLKIKNPSSRELHKKDALSTEQVKQVLEAMPRETLGQKRDYAIILLLVHTGLRTIEIERADVEDLRANMGANVLYVWGKGRDGKDQYVKITSSVMAAIKDYLAAREAVEGKLKDTDPLFISVSRRDFGGRISARSVSRICKETLRAAGYDDPRLTAHSFRHTAVSLSLLAGASIRDAQQMARHGSPVTTERYAHDLRRLEDAAEDKIEELLAS